MWTKALILIVLVSNNKSTALKENEGNLTECLVTAHEYEDVSLNISNIIFGASNVLILANFDNIF